MMSEPSFPFMVRYPFDVLRAVSQVEPLTMNGKSYGCGRCSGFALRYRRVNPILCEFISLMRRQEK